MSAHKRIGAIITPDKQPPFFTVRISGVNTLIAVVVAGNYPPPFAYYDVARVSIISAHSRQAERIKAHTPAPQHPAQTPKANAQTTTRTNL